MPRLLSKALLALLLLAACTSEPAPTAAPVPAATTPEVNQREHAQPRDPARRELTATSTPVDTGSPTPAPTGPRSTRRGITIAPEDRCSPYDPDDYPYSPSVEPNIVEGLGGVYGPYTGNWFRSIRATDIEHIVARSEAHDSGLCAASPATRPSSPPTS